jgi:hypothetical protein
MSDKLYVNGPIFAVRMEGEYNNVKKIIYLFGDQHNPPESQNACTEFDSVHITKYINDNIDKDTNYFLFHEVKSGDVNQDTHNLIKYYKPTKYMQYMTRFFLNMLYDKKNKNIKLQNDIYRDYIDLIYEYTMELSNYFKYNRPNNIIIVLEHILVEITYLHNIINGNELNLKEGEMLNNLRINYQKNYADYINNYKNNDLKKKLDKYNALLNNILNEIIKNINYALEITREILSIKIFTGYGAENDKSIKYHSILYELIEKIFTDVLRYGVIYMDLNLVKEILDSNDITNCIIYVGAYHLIQQSYILANDFNFKITHASMNEKIINIDDFNRMMHELSIHDVYYNYVENYNQQCVDLTHFPKKFQ